MVPIERQDRQLAIGVLVDAWVATVHELQLSDFRQFTEISDARQVELT